MENEKPKNWKEAALSHIPLELQHSMIRETTIQTDGMSPMEAILKATGSGPLPKQKTEAIPTDSFISIAVDGNVIKVPMDSTKAAIVLFMYVLAFELSKNKKIAKILKQFNFTMFDANNVQLYPKKKKKK